MNLSYGTATQQSSVRRMNLDRTFAYMEEERGLFMIAEAIGSVDAGSTALDSAIESISNALLPGLREPHNAGVLLNTLLAAYQQANERIIQANPDSGVSATTILINGQTVFIGHVGSTRAYAIAPDTIDCLTGDHTVEEQAVEFGYEQIGDPYEPMLYRIIGQLDEAADTLIHPLAPGTAILLVTDGVYRAGAQVINMGAGSKLVFPLNDDEILRVIHESANPQDVCERLVAEAHRRSNRDSATAVFISNGFSFVVE